MSNKSLNTFIELHLIQNFSPSNLNRDDTGSPKDCEFGGHRRARISSQALKRAIRNHPRFALMTGVENSTRSKWLIRQIVEILTDEPYNKEAESARDIASAFVEKYAAKLDKKPEKTSVLVFFSPDEVERITNILDKNWNEISTEAKGGEKIINDLVKEMVKETKNRTSAPDIALFGRMLASKPALNIDAASQISHAISTHRITMEMDYYTAVDELQQEDEAGAGMVGFTGFNSACFYRYCRIDWEQLVKNLDNNRELAQRTIAAFLRSAIDAIPTGKQNAFAAQNPTSFALTVLRQDGMSWNLANAFESPIQPQKVSQNTYTGYIAPSIQALEKLWDALTEFYDDAEITTLSVYAPKDYQERLGQLASNLNTTIASWIEPIQTGLTEM